VKDGIVSGGGKSMSYGDLVKGQQLKLTIPVSGSLTSIMGLTVEGNPPMKPVSEYTIIGKPYRNSVIPSKVAARETWATDVRLPGMLHARMVHPKTLGSTLVSAGQLDKTRFPNAQVVVKGNLVGVVAPTEWEAIRAAQQVAHHQVDRLEGAARQRKFSYLRQADWKATPVTKSEKSAATWRPRSRGPRRSSRPRTSFPFMKHAPIGPTMAVADARAGRDGAHLHAQPESPGAARRDRADARHHARSHRRAFTFAGPGHYGRSNGGNAGAEDEAVILSKAVGRPVRVQWMRPEDFQWSTQSPAAFSDVEIGLDANGKMVAYQIDHYMPAMQDDRPVGAVLAGLPTMPAPGRERASRSERPLDGQPAFRSVGVRRRRDRLWSAATAPSSSARKASPLNIGMRDHSMRTPGQFQQNYPRELAISEAAALAGVDAIQFRMDHAKEERVIGVLKAVRDASGWETRPSPHANAVSTGSTPVRGRGVSVMFRAGTYWACVCQIVVTPSTGAIAVEKYTIAVDPGIVVNPMQLKRQVEGGAVMGISHALLEEATFDESGITARDWRTYPILKMADIPEIKVVLLNRPDVGSYGGGSEAANALAAPAIAAALFDATGKNIRRLPLKPEYVQAVLKA
jgi:nicotinate dehydrogenase subunit B